MATTSASEVSVPVDGRKHTTCASCRGPGPSLALVGAGCSNQLQLAQRHKP